MPDSPAAFYDQLAAHQHLIFQDWERSMEWQAGVLGPLLEAQCGGKQLRLLDCSCGIGTQALGLARRGHRITACDASAAAVARARVETAARGLDIAFGVADMRKLDALPEAEFDAVLSIDNALPHLATDEDLLQASLEIRNRLRPGGVLLASIRDYDHLLRERPAIQGPVFYSDQGRRRIVHQVWDWTAERQYHFHLYITRETDAGWECLHYGSTYRALLRAELTTVLVRAEFTEVRWLLPEESGFYQPLVLARRQAAIP